MKEHLDKTVVRKRVQSKNKFLRLYPQGFNDPKYVRLREKQWLAHQQFADLFSREKMDQLLQEEDYQSVVRNALTAEKGAGLLYPAEKTLFRNFLKSGKNARQFALALFQLMHSKLDVKERFEEFRKWLVELSKRQQKLLSWPLQTVFAFLDKPDHFLFLKPRTTQAAAKAYGYDLFFEKHPNWNTYQSVYRFANQIREDVQDLGPKDFIDVQNFMKVIGSTTTKRK